MLQDLAGANSLRPVEICHLCDEIPELHLNVLPHRKRLPRFARFAKVGRKIDKTVEEGVILANVLKKTLEAVLIRKVRDVLGKMLAFPRRHVLRRPIGPRPAAAARPSGVCQHTSGTAWAPPSPGASTPTRCGRYCGGIWRAMGPWSRSMSCTTPSPASCRAGGGTEVQGFICSDWLYPPWQVVDKKDKRIERRNEPSRRIGGWRQRSSHKWQLHHRKRCLRNNFVRIPAGQLVGYAVTSPSRCTVLVGVRTVTKEEDARLPSIRFPRWRRILMY
jgi:hypothetical protein